MPAAEVPDMTVSLHSHENKPRILQASYVPWFMKERIDELIRRLNHRYKNAGLPYVPDDWMGKPAVEDKEFPPRSSFNLIRALHHISGPWLLPSNAVMDLLLKDFLNQLLPW